MSFDLLVLYRWKPGVTPERIAHHIRKIRGLNGRVPGMVEVRIGPQTMGFGPASQGVTHAAVMCFRDQASYQAFGRSPEHDEVAPELVADLAELSAVGFEG
jgi:hypothetical protein